ncbi:MAG TPA: 2-C-methyl-D-erythritol 4-phosphate cytidylyltransferase [Gemmatimonadales bacterium]|nr:2-C-methyl-D-erythritol 4-phosphate cytidylyltransferase [Gemmatimonadales bacterium]
MPRDVGAVIVAAGAGSRLGGVPKQYRRIGGVPMALRTLRAFTAHPDVAHAVLVLPPADAASPPEFLAGIVGAGLALAAGGAERSDSVAAGLAALAPQCRIVLVHDAARPFVSRAVIDAVIREARGGAGAVAAVPVTDTLKEAAAEDPHRVARTMPRERLWRAQTPQGFPRELLERAYARARADGVHATDDAALVERIGGEVRLVPDSPSNVKITTAEDLEWAELWATRG